MTTPNIKTGATLTAHNALALAGTTYGVVVSNASTSNALTKVSAVHICNLTAATSCAVTVAVSNGTTYYHIVAGQAVTVPVQPITRSGPVYLSEGDSICIYAATSGHLEAVVSYETVR